MAKLKILFSLSFGLVAAVSAWAPLPKARASFPRADNRLDVKPFFPFEAADASIEKNENVRLGAVVLSSALPIALFPSAASAATAFSPNAIPAAAAAYGHYIALIGIVACIMTERLTIKPNMSPEEEDLIAVADIGLGIFGALIAYTGYIRAVQYEKGFDFYSHEPLFWLKVAFVGVFGASSFFNTIIIIQRSIAKRNGNFSPMGEKLSKRMIQICNAELVAVMTIPLTATFMARGVWYSEDIPWQPEAGLATVVFAVLSVKYVKEAIQFEDNIVGQDL